MRPLDPVRDHGVGHQSEGVVVVERRIERRSRGGRVDDGVAAAIAAADIAVWDTGMRHCLIHHGSDLEPVVGHHVLCLVLQRLGQGVGGA